MGDIYVISTMMPGKRIKRSFITTFPVKNTSFSPRRSLSPSNELIGTRITAKNTKISPVSSLQFPKKHINSTKFPEIPVTRSTSECKMTFSTDSSFTLLDFDSHIPVRNWLLQGKKQGRGGGEKKQKSMLLRQPYAWLLGKSPPLQADFPRLPPTPSGRVKSLPKFRTKKQSKRLPEAEKTRFGPWKSNSRPGTSTWIIPGLC